MFSRGDNILSQYLSCILVYNEFCVRWVTLLAALEYCPNRIYGLDGTHPNTATGMYNTEAWKKQQDVLCKQRTTRQSNQA